MLSKPLKIRQLSARLKVNLDELTNKVHFPNSTDALGYELDENGEVTSLYLCDDLPIHIDIHFLMDFTALTRLKITNNYLTDLSPLRFLTNLEMLDLHNTGITDISAISNLTRLRYLVINMNRIRDLKGIENLTELQLLNVGKNRLTDMEPLRKLLKLQHLVISNNEIKDLSPILALPELDQVQMYNNPRVAVDYPPEIIRGGWNSIRQYSRQSSALVTYKSVKVLLLGNTSVGKTSLVSHLANKDHQTEISTHGVVYKHLVIDDITYNIWDFGGQEYFHATHRLFFSANALNLILWTAQAPNNEDNLSLDYWLRTVEQLNQKEVCEVFMVENKTDLSVPKFRASLIDQLAYQQRYPTVRFSYEAVSIKDQVRTDALLAKLKELSGELIHNFSYPEFYWVFKRRIDVLDKSVVTLKEINNRPAEANVIEAIKLFHNMGLLLYFPEVLKNKVFARPEDLLNLIYKKVLSEEKKYCLTRIEIEQAIDGNVLGLTAKELIALMKYFDLFFEIKSKPENYFIPQYLPKVSAWVGKLSRQIFRENSVIIAADNYLMSLAMQRIFSRYGGEAGKKEEAYFFWNNGIIIERDGVMLMVTFSREKQQIVIRLDQSEQSYVLQKELVDFVLDMPEDMKAPKRNYENHVAQRFRDASDEERLDFSYNIFESLSESTDDEVKEYLGRNYKRETNWSSEFFTVLISLDGIYFVDWKILQGNKELPKLKVIDSAGHENIEDTAMFFHYINLTEQAIVPEQTPISVELASIPSITYNFHAPVTAAAIGHQNTLHQTTVSSPKSPDAHSPKSATSDSTPGPTDDQPAFQKWKRWAIVCLILYTTIGLVYLILANVEVDVIHDSVIWENYSKGRLRSWLETAYVALGGVLIFKLAYDRLLDPSKQKAFFDLRKMNRN